MNNPVTVLGVGSPYGDDQVGWKVIEALCQSEGFAGLSEDTVAAHKCDRPGSQLVEYFKDAQATIIVDAVHSGAPPGTVHRLKLSDLDTGASSELLSSHGFGLADALALAKSLGALPNRVVIYGIEISPDAARPTPDQALSEDVAQAVETLLPLILGEISSGLRQGQALH